MEIPPVILSQTETNTQKQQSESALKFLRSYSKNSRTIKLSQSSNFTSSRKKLSQINDDLIQLEQKFTNFENTLKEIKFNNMENIQSAKQNIYAGQVEQIEEKKEEKKKPRIEKLEPTGKGNSKKEKIRIDNKIYQCKTIPISYFQNLGMLFNKKSDKNNKIKKLNKSKDNSYRIKQQNFIKNHHQSKLEISSDKRQIRCKKIINQQFDCIEAQTRYQDQNKQKQVESEEMKLSELISQTRTRQLRQCKRMMKNQNRTNRYCLCCSHHESGSPSPSPSPIKKQETSKAKSLINIIRCTRTAQSNRNRNQRVKQIKQMEMDNRQDSAKTKKFQIFDLKNEEYKYRKEINDGSKQLNNIIPQVTDKLIGIKYKTRQLSSNKRQSNKRERESERNRYTQNEYINQFSNRTNQKRISSEDSRFNKIRNNSIKMKQVQQPIKLLKLSQQHEESNQPSQASTRIRNISIKNEQNEKKIRNDNKRKDLKHHVLNQLQNELSSNKIYNEIKQKTYAAQRLQLKSAPSPFNKTNMKKYIFRKHSDGLPLARLSKIQQMSYQNSKHERQTHKKAINISSIHTNKQKSQKSSHNDMEADKPMRLESFSQYQNIKGKQLKLKQLQRQVICEQQKNQQQQLDNMNDISEQSEEKHGKEQSEQFQYQYEHDHEGSKNQQEYSSQQIKKNQMKQQKKYQENQKQNQKQHGQKQEQEQEQQKQQEQQEESNNSDKTQYLFERTNNKIRQIDKEMQAQQSILPNRISIKSRVLSQKQVESQQEDSKKTIKQCTQHSIFTIEQQLTHKLSQQLLSQQQISPKNAVDQVNLTETVDRLEQIDQKTDANAAEGKQKQKQIVQTNRNTMLISFSRVHPNTKINNIFKANNYKTEQDHNNHTPTQHKQMQQQDGQTDAKKNNKLQFLLNNNMINTYSWKELPRLPSNHQTSLNQTNNKRISNQPIDTVHILSQNSNSSVGLFHQSKRKPSIQPSIPSSVNLVLKYVESQGYFDTPEHTQRQSIFKQMNNQQRNEGKNKNKKVPISANLIGFTSSQFMIGNQDTVVEDTSHFLSTSSVNQYEKQSISENQMVEQKENIQDLIDNNRKEKNVKIKRVVSQISNQIENKCLKMEIGVQCVDKLQFKPQTNIEEIHNQKQPTISICRNCKDQFNLVPLSGLSNKKDAQESQVVQLTEMQQLKQDLKLEHQQNKNNNQLEENKKENEKPILVQESQIKQKIIYVPIPVQITKQIEQDRPEQLNKIQHKQERKQEKDQIQKIKEIKTIQNLKQEQKEYQEQQEQKEYNRQQEQRKQKVLNLQNLSETQQKQEKKEKQKKKENIQSKIEKIQENIQSKIEKMQNKIESIITNLDNKKEQNQRNNKLKLCSKILCVEQKIKLIKYHHAYSIAIKTSRDETYLALQGTAQSFYGPANKQSSREQSQIKLNQQTQQTNKQLHQQMTEQQHQKNNDIGELKNKFSMTPTKQEKSKKIKDEYAQIYPFIHVNGQKYPSNSIQIQVECQQSRDRKEIIQHFQIVQQIMNYMPQHMQFFMQRLCTPGRSAELWYFNGLKFQLYSLKIAQTNLTHQVLVQCVSNHIYSQQDEVSDFRTYLKALTGCPILKLEHTHWNKIKNIKKHENIYGFAVHPTGQVYRIMGTNEQKKQVDLKQKKQKIIKLKKNNGKCINVSWQKFIKCYKNPFLIGIHYEYYVRYAEIKKNSKKNEIYIIDLHFRQNKALQKIHFVMALESGRLRNQVTMTVYEQIETNKYVNKGSADPSFTSMHLKSMSCMLVFEGFIDQGYRISMCSSNYFQLKNERWACNMEKLINCPQNNQQLIKYDSI